MARYNLEGTDEFAIDGDTGELTVKNNVLLDYEGPTKSFKFFVEAYDNNPTDTTSKINPHPKFALVTVNSRIKLNRSGECDAAAYHRQVRPNKRLMLNCLSKLYVVA